LNKIRHGLRGLHGGYANKGFGRMKKKKFGRIKKKKFGRMNSAE